MFRLQIVKVVICAKICTLITVTFFLLGLDVNNKETISEFVVDINTIFLCHYNTTTTADVASGTAVPISSKCPITETEEGYFGRGLNIGKVSKALIYRGDDGNFNRNTGTIEFWFKPNWSSTSDSSEATDGVRYHAFFTYGNNMDIGSGSGDESSFIIGTDDYWNNFSIRGINNDGEEFKVTSSTGLDFKEGNWYHIAMTYNNFNSGTDNASIRLYRNNVLISTLSNKKISFEPCSSMYISGFWGQHVANGIIDELRISDKIRYGRE